MMNHFKFIYMRSQKTYLRIKKLKIMAVLYRVYKDNRENSLTSGQYFARAIHTDTIGLKEMAMEIEENVSVKYSDVSAVLIELVNVMNRHLNASRRVKLDGFGAFKIGLKTKAADTADDFNAKQNVVGCRLNLYLGKRFRAKDLYKDMRIKEADFYTVDEDGDGEDASVEP